MESLKNIPGYYRYSDLLSSGGQPSGEQFKQLKESGVDVVINLSPVSAKNALLTEHELVEQLKIDYIHFPVDCSDLRDIHYLTIRALLNAVEGQKVFIHCGGNIKSSNLIHMYHVLEKDMNEYESLRILLKIQQPEGKWFGFFKRMGMQGIRDLDKT